MQNNRWEELLAVYLEAVKAVLPSDVRAPTLVQLHHELRFHALYGYAHLLFAVPYIINNDPFGLNEGNDGGGASSDESSKKTVQDLLIFRLDSAEAKITEILSGTVRHIIDHGYAEQYEYASNSLLTARQ